MTSVSILSVHLLLSGRQAWLIQRPSVPNEGFTFLSAFKSITADKSIEEVPFCG